MEGTSSMGLTYTELQPMYSPPPAYQEPHHLFQTYQKDTMSVQSASNDSLDNPTYYRQYEYVPQKNWTSDNNLASTSYSEWFPEVSASNPAILSPTSVSARQTTHLPSPASAPCLPSYQDPSWPVSGTGFSQTPLSETNMFMPPVIRAAPPSWRSPQYERQSQDIAELINLDCFSSDLMPQTGSETGSETPRSNSVPADMFLKPFDAFTKPSPK